MKFKKPKSWNRKAKLSDSQRIYAMYKKNKKVIDSKLKGVNKYKSFKQIIKDNMEEGMSLNESVEKLQNSSLFTSSWERFDRKLKQELKANGLWKQVRELNKQNGKYAKFNPVWSKTQKVYTFGEGYYIDFKNSPKSIIIGWIDPRTLEHVPLTEVML